MTLTILMAVFVVLAAWAIATWAIWKWGPGERTWEVWCPVYKKEARIVAIQREAEFVPSYAGLQVFDVKRCSLFKDGGPVNCRKECLARP
ncbi:MAG TPA: hypothetical protein VMH00_16100 [Candidatus Limnocylindrales bacterium]|nr:hypothetical protein [Candidatus Limnocylindrales bacterium]